MCVYDNTRINENIKIIFNTIDKKSTDGKKNEVRGESNQEKEEQIMVKNKECQSSGLRYLKKGGLN